MKMNEMVDMIKQDSEERMQKSVEALKAAFVKIRTGRAHTSLLDHITVVYYGSEVPLKQVATVNVLDPRTLGVSPWEKNMVDSDLGLNPAVVGSLLRVPLPPMTEERRRELVKVVRQEAEGARIAIRNIRRDANHELKDLVKDKEISEDDERRASDAIQKLTDQLIAEVDDVLGKKEKELTEI